MKEKIDVNEYAQLITDMLGKGGFLLNTNGEKFNSMVIGWGHLGRIWNIRTFAAYVRQSRYTKAQIDRTGEFTLSIPLTAPDPEIGRICGTLSGRDIDKVKEANLTLEPPQTNHTPGIKEYPLTVECRVLYAQDQDLSKIPENIQNACYPSLVPGSTDPADRDFHTMYIAEILDAYIIR